MALPGDTEAATPHGWRALGSIDPAGTPVLSYHPGTRTFSFDLFPSIQRHESRPRLVRRLSSLSFSMEATSCHALPVLDRRGGFKMTTFGALATAPSQQGILTHGLIQDSNNPEGILPELAALLLSRGAPENSHWSISTNLPYRRQLVASTLENSGVRFSTRESGDKTTFTVRDVPTDLSGFALFAMSPDWYRKFITAACELRFHTEDRAQSDSAAKNVVTTKRLFLVDLLQYACHVTGRRGLLVEKTQQGRLIYKLTCVDRASLRNSVTLRADKLKTYMRDCLSAVCDVKVKSRFVLVRQFGHVWIAGC